MSSIGVGTGAPGGGSPWAVTLTLLPVRLASGKIVSLVNFMVKT